MKALVITEHGPPDVMRVQERPDPEPGQGEVRIRVRAAGVNFADLLARVGLYDEAPKPPCVVGYEVAGDIDAIGDGRSEEHTSELQSHGPISYAVFCTLRG